MILQVAPLWLHPKATWILSPSPSRCAALQRTLNRCYAMPSRIGISHKDWCSEVKIQGSLNATYKLMRNQIYGNFLNYQYWVDQNGIKQRKSMKCCLSWCDIMRPFILRNWWDNKLGDQFLTTDWNGTCLLFQSSNLLGQNWAIPAIIPTQIILFAPIWWHSYNPKDRLYTCIMSSELHCLVSVQTPFCLVKGLDSWTNKMIKIEKHLWWWDNDEWYNDYD